MQNINAVRNETCMAVRKPWEKIEIVLVKIYKKGNENSSFNDKDVL